MLNLSCIFILSSFLGTILQFQAFQFSRFGSSNLFQHHELRFKRLELMKSTRLSANLLDNIDINQSTDEGMPDKNSFSEYYKSKVKKGVMTKDQFIKYSEVTSLLNKNLILSEDIDSLWVSAVGDADGLDADEAYEMLCMVMDLPDPEDTQYYETEFQKLVGDKGTLAFNKFLMWSEVQDMLSDDALSMEDLTNLWRKAAGDLNGKIDIDTFRKLNNLIDDALDATDEDDKDDGDKQGDNSAGTGGGEGEDESVVDPKEFFDVETYSDLASFFYNNKKNDRITLSAIESWDDIQDMIKEKLLTKKDITETWNDVAQGAKDITLDDFLQFNIKLDLIMDKNEGLNSGNNKDKTSATTAGTGTGSGEEDVEAFYRSEFKELMGDQRIMPVDIFLEWKEMKEILNEGLITKNKIESLFNSMPRESIGLPSTVLGINIDSFVRLNQIIDILIESDADEQDSTIAVITSPDTSSTSSIFSSKTKDDIMSLKEDDSTATESELELMKMLDTADNLLNSGSFEDFDKLIGDENDPRLDDVRRKASTTTSAAAVLEKKGNLIKDLSEFITICKQQKKCGLEVPDEFVSVQMFDLYQGILQNAQPLIKQDINNIKQTLNGKWKLLYTNSEMFRFYNGMTGFPNVFPATKFDSISLEYMTDGYLNELKYYEQFTNPIGGLEAVVYGNWDLVKETSFMTNQQSVILRAYCTKVTAGPMTYEAQENWKSLRTLSMNELVYIDDKYLIMRNCGALRIYFVLERE